MKMRLICLLAAATAPAWACSCAGFPSAKEAWLESPLVFAGLVEKTDPKFASEDEFAGVQTAWVRVTEPFKGVKKDQILELVTPSVCSGGYREGSDLLLYLFPGPKEATWMARGCHRSRTLKSAEDDLRFLRELPGSARGNRVSGTVELWEDGPSGKSRQVSALPGLRVQAIGTWNSYEAFTGTGGLYEFRDLEPGSYTIKVDQPKATVLRFLMPYGKNTQRHPVIEGDAKLTVTADSSNGFDFNLAPDARIAGTVFAPDGRPMKGVCIDAEPVRSGSAVPSLSSCTQSDGSYSLGRLSPGTYRIVANRNGELSASAPFGRLYYPGTSEVEKAGTVPVAAGQHIDGIDFRVPELAGRIELRGRLTFSNGVPLPNQSVLFQESGQDVYEYGRTDAEGNFMIQALAGRAGSLVGDILLSPSDFASCPQLDSKLSPDGVGAIVRTSPLPVAGDKSLSGIQVTFPFPSCDAWLEKEASRKRP